MVFDELSGSADDDFCINASEICEGIAEVLISAGKIEEAEKYMIKAAAYQAAAAKKHIENHENKKPLRKNLRSERTLTHRL